MALPQSDLWLNQKQLTELFGKAKGTISEHIKHIFEDGELTPEATVRLFRTVQNEGDREVVREVECYNLLARPGVVRHGAKQGALAIHGQTAAEVIVSRADSGMPNMGLTTWEGVRIRKSDAAIAKNCLNEQQLRALNNLVETDEAKR